jgi:hypothetical protein
LILSDTDVEFSGSINLFHRFCDSDYAYDPDLYRLTRDAFSHIPQDLVAYAKIKQLAPANEVGGSEKHTATLKRAGKGFAGVDVGMDEAKEVGGLELAI